MRTLLETGANIEAQDVDGQLDIHYFFKYYIREKMCYGNLNILYRFKLDRKEFNLNQWYIEDLDAHMYDLNIEHANTK